MKGYRIKTARLLFQSSPPSQGGRYRNAPVPSRDPRIVSILAPLARGALPKTFDRGFHRIDVSILAPLARGALP